MDEHEREIMSTIALNHVKITQPKLINYVVALYFLQA